MSVSSKLASAFAALLVISTVAVAHDAKPRYGGRIEDIGNFHVELVVQSRVVEVFLSDANEKPMKADGYKGLVILAVEGKSERVTLAPSESRDGNKLGGLSSVELPAKPRGVVQITLPDGKAVSARFQ